MPADPVSEIGTFTVNGLGKMSGGWQSRATVVGLMTSEQRAELQKKTVKVYLFEGTFGVRV